MNGPEICLRPRPDSPRKVNVLNGRDVADVDLVVERNDGVELAGDATSRTKQRVTLQQRAAHADESQQWRPETGDVADIEIAGR